MGRCVRLATVRLCAQPWKLPRFEARMYTPLLDWDCMRSCAGLGFLARAIVSNPSSISRCRRTYVSETVLNPSLMIPILYPAVNCSRYCARKWRYWFTQVLAHTVFQATRIIIAFHLPDCAIEKARIQYDEFSNCNTGFVQCCGKLLMEADII